MFWKSFKREKLVKLMEGTLELGVFGERIFLGKIKKLALVFSLRNHL